MDFSLLFFICITSLQVICAAPPVEVHPRKIIHLEGETLTAMCRVGVPISYCRWTVPGVGGLNLNPRLGPHEGIKYQGRSLENGECGISIQNVREKHNGVLSCNLGYATEPAESTGNMTLVIAKAPRAPQINVTGLYAPKPGYPPDTFQEGETIRAECRIENGRPVANISWFIGTEPIYDGLGSPVIEDAGYGGQKTIRQTVTRLLKYADNGKDLRCVAGHIALGPGNINHSIYKLNVYFPPKPKSREIEQFGFTIGQPGKVVVTFHANPLPNIEWSVDGHRIQEGARDPTGRFHSAVLANKGQGTWDAVLNIAQVTSEEVEKSYTLLARNRFGQETYRVAISTSPAPPAEITAGAIAAIVIAALLILLLIFILIFARATGKWCFAGSVANPRQAGESSPRASSLLSRVIGKKSGTYNIGSLTYKDYKLVEAADGRKSYVSPEIEKQILIEKKIKEDEASFENEVASAKRSSKRKPSDSTLSGSSYETPIQKADSIDLDKSAEILPKPVIYKTFDDLQKESASPADVFLEKRHTYPFSEKKPVDVFGDDKAARNLPPPLKPFDTFSDDGERLKMPPHIKPVGEEEEKQIFKPETPVKPLSFDWVFKKKKPDNADSLDSEERKEAKKKIKNIFSKSSEEAETSSDSDSEKQEEPRKSSALKFPNLFGIRSSKRDKPEEHEKKADEKIDKPEIKIEEVIGEVKPLQELKDGEWVDVPSEFSKRDEKPESSFKKLLGINNKNEDENKEHSDGEEKSEHKRLPSLKKWLKNRSKPEEPIVKSEEAESKEKAVDVNKENADNEDDKPEEHTRLPSLKKWLKNRAKPEDPNVKEEDTKAEDSEVKDEIDENKAEHKKSLTFNIGKYFGKTEDKTQTKEDVPKEEQNAETEGTKPEITEVKDEPDENKVEQSKKSSAFNFGKYFGKAEDKTQRKEDVPKQEEPNARTEGTEPEITEVKDEADENNAEQPKKSSAFNFGKYFGKAEEKAQTKNAPIQEANEKAEDTKPETAEVKDETDENKPEQPKKLSGFSIGKYFSKTEDKSKDDAKSKSSDSESDIDADEVKKRSKFQKWLGKSKDKARTEEDTKSKSSDSDSDDDAEETKKQSRFKKWLGSGRKSKAETKVESEDSFKKEMKQTGGRELEDKFMEKTDNEEDKVSEFTSGSQEELAKPETIVEEPANEDESEKAEEKKEESKRGSRTSMKVPPPLPPNPPPLPLIPPPHSAWGPRTKKEKNRASNRQSNSSISSSSRESILNPDSDKKGELKPRSWKLLDDPEKIEVLDDQETPEEKIKDKKPKKKKKSRPVSFAENVATVMGPTSDTESADHGSADKSSVSKLTNEKQSKKPKLMSGLIDSFKKKSRDKVADNEASRGVALETNKDPEQLPLDGAKTEGIVYAELDIARGQGNVMRRDDDKTEYAEIIHPKPADHKKSKEELRKSRENLSGSREHLTEPEGEPKKEATV